MQIGSLIADDVRLDGDLVIVVHVHEMEAIAVLVEELMLAFFHGRPLDLLGGLVALLGLYPVADPAHVHLRGRGALAGMETFGVQHDVELAVEFDDIALAERRGDDSHDWSSMACRTETARFVGAHLTHLAPAR